MTERFLPKTDRLIFIHLNGASRVAELLRGREIGDGVVARAVREAQAQFMRPPRERNDVHIRKPVELTNSQLELGFVNQRGNLFEPSAF